MYCERSINNKGSLKAHENVCKQNPNRIVRTRLPTKTSGKHFNTLVSFVQKKGLTNEQVFIENSNYPRCHLKERIIKQNLISYICEQCDILGEYNGKPLSLQLDHKNGINNDNRINNLRFLCPNCHSQQDTYAGKNIVFRKLIPDKCYGSTTASKPDGVGSTPTSGAI